MTELRPFALTATIKNRYMELQCTVRALTQEEAVAQLKQFLTETQMYHADEVIVTPAVPPSGEQEVAEADECKLFVNLMLEGARSAEELHEMVDAAVDWIEAHSAATKHTLAAPLPSGLEGDR
jgi:hypothetical protein